MSTTLASPKRLAIAAVPVIGMIITPFLPFVSSPPFGWACPPRSSGWA